MNYLASQWPALDREHKVSEKVGRNEPCRCASVKKYKKCCGT
jgi:uncharacterized protein YecA (UPF0149 family)